MELAHVGLGIATAKHSTPDSRTRRELAPCGALVERVDRIGLVKYRAIVSVMLGDSHRLLITFLICG